MKICLRNIYIFSPIRRLWNHFLTDSLFRNAIYLMLATVVMAFLGFFFWMINARLFTTEQIGLTTTIISAMSLITSFCILGLDSGLIRYLPKSERKNNQINTCFSFITLTTLIATFIFIAGLKTFSPKLLFIRQNPYYLLLFIIFMVFSTANIFIDNIFIAFRDTKFILVKNTIFSLLKLIFPFLMVTFGTYGILGSWMAALIAGFIFGFIILMTKFSYNPQLLIDKNIINEIGGYSFGNYVAGFFGGLSSMVLPLMITNMLNPEVTAHYYMAMMIASLLFIIPQATTQSLFAEGSYNEKDLIEHIKKSVKIVSLILIPAIIMVMFLSKYVLLVFGKNYSVEGFRFLQIIALSGIFVSINYIFGTILRVKQEIGKLIAINLLASILILGFSYLLISKGLLGIGLAWIIGNMIISGVYGLVWKGRS